MPHEIIQGKTNESNGMSRGTFENKCNLRFFTMKRVLMLIGHFASKAPPKAAPTPCHFRIYISFSLSCIM